MFAVSKYYIQQIIIVYRPETEYVSCFSQVYRFICQSASSLVSLSKLFLLINQKPLTDIKTSIIQNFNLNNKKVSLIYKRKWVHNQYSKTVLWLIFSDAQRRKRAVFYLYVIIWLLPRHVWLYYFYNNTHNQTTSCQCKLSKNLVQCIIEAQLALGPSWFSS